MMQIYPMRKALLCVLTVCASIFSFAQTTIPLDSFYVVGSTWTEVATTNDNPCSAAYDVGTYGIVYRIEKDSIISGKTYHMLSSCFTGDCGYSIDCNTGVSTSYADNTPCVSPPPIFAMIRTDSNRVYFTLLKFQVESPYNFYDCDTVEKEYLFYDFNLRVGSVTPASVLGGGLTVTSIDSVSLSNGESVARYSNYNDTVLYGIGEKNGFINYWNLYTCGPGPSATQYLLCYHNPYFSYQFSYPAGTLPGNLQYDCFDMAENIAYFDSLDAVLNNHNNNPTPTGSVFSIYPNPAANQLIVSDVAPIVSISIVNCMGQTVYNSWLDTSYYSNSVEQIDITALPAGTYFIKVNSYKAQKFVKQFPH